MSSRRLWRQDVSEICRAAWHTTRGRAGRVSLLVATCPLLAAALLWSYGRLGPSVLHDSSGEYSYAYCTGGLPAVTWRGMRRGHGRLESDDLLGLFWGGLPASTGDMLVACGPEGVAIARGQRSGYFHASNFWGFGVVFLGAAVAALIVFAMCRSSVAAFVRLRAAFAIPEGHCQACGYDLTGLSEPRCPECGTPFASGRGKAEM